VTVATGPQQQRGRVDGAGGDDDDGGGIFLDGAVAAHDHARDLAAGGARLQTLDIGASEQGGVRMRERRVHADHVRVRLRAHEAGMAVASRAPDARASLRLALVQHDAERNVEGAKPLSSEVVGELLDARLVADGRMRVRIARRRIRRIDTALAVHLVEALGAPVVRLEVLVGDRPGGGHTVVVLQLAEVLSAHAGERRAVELGVAADPVVGVRMELASVAVAPRFLRVVLAVHVDGARGPVVPLARHVAAALQEQDPLARRGQRVEEGAAAGARPDDDHVVPVGHGALPSPLSARAVRRTGNGRCRA
jgi:hypothetical protein